MAFAVIAQAVELGVANARIRAHVPVAALFLYGGSLTESVGLQNRKMRVQILLAVILWPYGEIRRHASLRN